MLSLPGLPLGGGSGGLSQSEGAQARVLSVDRCLFRVPGHRSWPTLDLHYGVRQEEHCRKPRPNRTLATFRYRRFSSTILFFGVESEHFSSTATTRPNGFVQFPVSPVHQPRQWFSLPRTLATRLSADENGIVRSSHRASRLCGAVLHVKIQPSNILSKLGLERRTELVRWHEPI